MIIVQVSSGGLFSRGPGVRNEGSDFIYIFFSILAKEVIFAIFIFEYKVREAPGL